MLRSMQASLSSLVFSHSSIVLEDDWVVLSEARNADGDWDVQLIQLQNIGQKYAAHDHQLAWFMVI